MNGLVQTNKQKMKINEQTKPHKNKHGYTAQKRDTRGEGGEVKMGKGGQLYDDGWKISIYLN